MVTRRGILGKPADLAVIGAGASGTHLLLALLKQLMTGKQKPARQLTILVIDHDAQFFAGVAYGRRSGGASLTLSSLSKFLPDDERAQFIEWLTTHIDDVLSSADIDPAWVYKHHADIVAGRWEHLALPRRLYGRYLDDLMKAAISQAQSQGVAQVLFVNATVTSVQSVRNGYVLTTSNRDRDAAKVDAASVVLAVGSPPVRRLATVGAPGGGLIHDIHNPSLDETLMRLGQHLTALPRRDRRMLVIGGNADALEFVLASYDLVRNLDARVTVLSPSGRPRHWRRKTPDEVADLPAVTGLKDHANAGGKVTAAALYEAVVSDVTSAVIAGTDIAAVPKIADVVPSFFDAFDEAERSALVARYGIPITNLLREDCGDAVDILNGMAGGGILDFLRGRYHRARHDNASYEVTATDNAGRLWTLDRRFGAIVGAVGFEKVSTTGDRLIQQLLHDGMAQVSSSDAGLSVDSRFSAAPRLFVVGPLLAGNANSGMLIWHAESVRRIIGIAEQASAHVARELHKIASEVLLTA